MARMLEPWQLCAAGSEVWWYGEGMASSKVTLTLDAATIRRLRDAKD
jgi:hypothetical protein